MVKREAILVLVPLLVALPTILPSSGCGGRLERNAPTEGAAGVSSTTSGSAGSGAQGGGGSHSGASAGSSAGASGGSGGGTTGGGNGGGGNAGSVDGGTTGGPGGLGGIGGAGGWPWQLCSWIQTAFDAPTSAIGVEFGAPQPGGGGEMYYLVAGPSDQPVRGPGPDYQRRYDVALMAERLFQINLHRPTGVVAANLWAYTCPEQFDIRTSNTGTRIARFSEW